MNLRTELPDISNHWLEMDWLNSKALMAELGHGEIPRVMMIPTRKVLHKTVQAMQAVDILDIETYVGTSALNFALARPQARIVSVDKKPREFRATRSGRDETPEQLLARAGLHNVEFRIECSLKYLRSAGKFDFICIDGCHKQSHVFSEIPLALAALKPGGLIFLDDMQPEDYVPLPGWDRIPGPWRAVQSHIIAGMPIKVAPVVHEGAKTATAFILKC